MISKKQYDKFVELIIEYHEDYIQQILRIEKNSSFNYEYHITNLTNFSSFKNQIDFHDKYKNYNDIFNDKKTQEESLIKSLMCLEDTLNIIEDQLFQKCLKEAKKQLRNNDSHSFYLKGYNVVKKPHLHNITQIKVILSKENFTLNKFKNINKEDQILLLNIPLDHFYYYSNNPNTIFFVLLTGEVIKINTKGYLIEYYVFNESLETEFISCKESEILEPKLLGEVCE